VFQLGGTKHRKCPNYEQCKLKRFKVGIQFHCILLFFNLFIGPFAWLPLPTDVCVYLSVHRISQKIIDRFAENYVKERVNLGAPASYECNTFSDLTLFPLEGHPAYENATTAISADVHGLRGD